MKIIAWILVIWIVGSLIYGTMKEGVGWLAPIKNQYEISFEEHPIITIIVTIVICVVLISVLF